MKTFVNLLIVWSIGLAATGQVFASGSYNISGGNPANQSYNLGKSAFYRKLACSSCPLADQDIDAGKAADLLGQLAADKDLGKKLSETERDAVIVYLKRRYKLD